MVLFYKCITTLVSFMAWNHLDGQQVGMAGIFDQDQTDISSVFNLTAFDCLTSSILQFMILYCLKSRFVLEKQMNLNSELSEAIDLIITNIQTDKDKSTPLGLVLAKYSHEDQNEEDEHFSAFIKDVLRCLKNSTFNDSQKVNTQIKILFKNKNLEKVLGDDNELQGQTQFCSNEFSQKLHLDKILVDNTLGKQTFVSVIKCVKDIIKK